MLQALTPEDMCKKLRPVFGEKMDRVFLRYKMCDSWEKKKEIEQALSALYHRYLNQNILTDKILLQPPSKNDIEGDYPLGKIIYAEKELHEFGLREKDWPRHVCITGMSGSGKTNFAYQILGNFIYKKKPFLAFDWKKSFRPLMTVNDNIMCFTVGNPNGCNLFGLNINKPPKGVPPKEWINILCDLLSECFFTSYGVHKLLSEVLDKAYKDFGVYEGSENYPTWLQIKDRLEKKAMNMEKSHGRESEWLTSAMRIAHTLTFGEFGKVVNMKGTSAMKVEELLDKQIIFELQALNSIEKKFFCEFILTYIYKLKKASDEQQGQEFKHAILVDEAHNIFLKDRPHFVQESITEVVYREIREYGTSLICLDQHISKLSDVVAGNSACNIAFQQMLPADIECMAALMQLKDQKQVFSLLPVGQAIVKLAERYNYPFLIEVPLVNLKAKLVTDEFLNKRMKDLLQYDKKIEEAQLVQAENALYKDIQKTDKVMANAGMGMDVQPGESAACFTEEIEELEKKGRVVLTNHLQRDIVQQIRPMFGAGNEAKTIKEYIASQGYKSTDINRAIKFVLAERARGRISLTEKERITKTKIISLAPEEKQMIEFLFKYPDYSVSQVYKYLKLSARKGTKLKNKLLELKLINVKEEKNQKGWIKKMVLRQEVLDYHKNVQMDTVRIF